MHHDRVHLTLQFDYVSRSGTRSSPAWFKGQVCS